jgi:hypothetical protein
VKQLQKTFGLFLIFSMACLLAGHFAQAGKRDYPLNIAGTLKIEMIDSYFAPQKEMINLTPNPADAENKEGS